VNTNSCFSEFGNTTNKKIHLKIESEITQLKDTVTYIPIDVSLINDNEHIFKPILFQYLSGLFVLCIVKFRIA